MKIERIKELIESIPIANRENQAFDTQCWIDGYTEARDDIIDLLTTQEAIDIQLIDDTIKRHNTDKGVS